MLSYEDLMRLLENVEITYQYQPVNYQPSHPVIHQSTYRTFLKNRENESNMLGSIDKTILSMFCYDAPLKK